MTGSPIVPGDLFARHQLINGLVELAAFLEANPSVPIDEYGDTVTVYTGAGTDTDQRDQVDRVASLLGVQVQDRTAVGGHYVATKSFGRIRYQIVHIPARSRQQHQARLSYADNIRTDLDQNDHAA